MNPGPPPPCGPCTLFSLDRVSSTGDVCMSLSSSRVLFRGERVSSSWSRPLMESVPPESWRVGVTGEGSGSISPPVDRLCGDGERGEGWCVPLIVPLSRCQQPLDSPEGHPEGPSGRVLSPLPIRRSDPPGSARLTPTTARYGTRSRYLAAALPKARRVVTSAGNSSGTLFPGLARTLDNIDAVFLFSLPHTRSKR